MDWQALWLSIQLALATTLILLVVGLPLAHWLATFQTKSKVVLHFMNSIEVIVSLPLVLPPTVIGFYVLSAIGPQSLVGHFYETLTGGLLPFSFMGLLIGSCIYSLPFAVQPFLASFRSLDQRLIEASWCLGVSRLETFFRLVLPLCRPGILTGIILSFAHTLGEFGVVLMIGGNIDGVTRTVSVSIFDDVQALNYLAAGKMSVILLLISFVILSAVNSFQRSSLRLWQQN
ncbi:MAG: molybdate ABC transporter permease subunit [Bdellovibrionia bacterium]